MNNKIYIAGKITGDPDFKEKFKNAAYLLEFARRDCPKFKQCQSCLFYDRDYLTTCRISSVFPQQLEIVNPITFGFENRIWLFAMVGCVRRLLKCRYVYMLNDWQKSRGAKIEHWFAKLLHKQIIYQK